MLNMFEGDPRPMDDTTPVVVSQSRNPPPSDSCRVVPHSVVAVVSECTSPYSYEGSLTVEHKGRFVAVVYGMDGPTGFDTEAVLLGEGRGECLWGAQQSYMLWKQRGGDILKGDWDRDVLPEVFRLPLVVFSDTGKALGGESRAPFTTQTLTVELGDFGAVQGHWCAEEMCLDSGWKQVLHWLGELSDFSRHEGVVWVYWELSRLYPVTSSRIVELAHLYGVTPLVRKLVWGAGLGLWGARDVSTLVDVHVEEVLEACGGKGERLETQLTWDLPRCRNGDKTRMERLLKGWSGMGGKYWQGLCPMAAPILQVYQRDSLAMEAFAAFIRRYEARFFVLEDLDQMNHMWMSSFMRLLCFHDAQLASHLDSIGFTPQLYAVPWFITMFAHVLPSEEILVLWDALMVESDLLPLFVAVQVLRNFRTRLLEMDLNECIVFKANIIVFDISECVSSAILLMAKTPASCLAIHPCSTRNGEDILDLLGALEVPSIAAHDLHEYRYTSVFVDTRALEEFREDHWEYSVHLKKDQETVESLPALASLHAKIHTSKHDSVTIVVGDRAHEVALEYIKLGIDHVCLLQGPVEDLMHAQEFRARISKA